MEPLTVAQIGDEYTVIKLGGLAETRHHLANLGFVEGATVRVINKLDSGYIVAVKDARVALDQNLAGKIFVQEVPCLKLQPSFTA